MRKMCNFCGKVIFDENNVTKLSLPDAKQHMMIDYFLCSACADKISRSFAPIKKTIDAHMFGMGSVDDGA